MTGDAIRQLLAETSEACDPKNPRGFLYVREQRKLAVPKLVAALTAVLDKHQPVKRYQPWEACDHSWDTAQEAADAGCVELAEVSHFEVCAHCGNIEMAEENDRDYRESLWPCATYRAVAAALQEQP